MEEGDSYPPMQTKRPTFEERLSKRKHTMEFIRTMIGFIVLGIQMFILYHLAGK